MPKIHPDLKYSKKLVDRLKIIKKQILLYGRSFSCPDWTGSITEDCQICKAMFPKAVQGWSCPCHAYTPKYLIKRLTEIINHLEQDK